MVLNFLRFGVINAKSFDRYSLHFLLLKGTVIIIAACCCDGIYNMDLEEAAACADLVKAKHNIPYHMTAADSGSFFDRDRAEAFNAENRLIIEEGEEIEL